MEPYVGELWIAHTADSMLKDGSINSTTPEEYEALPEEEREKIMEEKLAVMQEESEFKKTKRQVICAKNLRDRVRPYLESTNTTGSNKDEVEKTFRQHCHEEAVKISTGAMGDFYLKTIGFSLEVNSGKEIFLG